MGPEVNNENSGIDRVERNNERIGGKRGNERVGIGGTYLVFLVLPDPCLSSCCWYGPLGVTCMRRKSTLQTTGTGRAPDQCHRRRSMQC